MSPILSPMENKKNASRCHCHRQNRGITPVNEQYPIPTRNRAYLQPRFHPYTTEHSEDILLDAVLRITSHERPKRFERQLAARSRSGKVKAFAADGTHWTYDVIRN